MHSKPGKGRVGSFIVYDFFILLLGGFSGLQFLSSLWESYLVNLHYFLSFIDNGCVVLAFFFLGVFNSNYLLGMGFGDNSRYISFYCFG